MLKTLPTPKQQTHHKKTTMLKEGTVFTSRFVRLLLSRDSRRVILMDGAMQETSNCTCMKQLQTTCYIWVGIYLEDRKGDWYFSLPPHLQPDSQRPGAWLGAAYVLYNSLEREERLEKKLLT